MDRNLSYIFHLFQRRRLDILALVSFSAVLAFGARGFFGKPVLAAGDLSAFPLTTGQIFEFITSAWFQMLHGASVSVIDQPMVFKLFFLLISNGDPAVAQRLFLFFPYFLAFASMYFFLGHFGVNRVARYISAGLFAINSVTIDAFVPIGWMYGYAILPILTFLVFRLTSQNSKWEKIRDLLLFSALLTTAFNFTQTAPFFIAPIIVFALIRRGSIFGIVKFVKSSAIFLGGIAIFGWFYVITYFGLLGETAKYLVPGAIQTQSLGINYVMNGASPLFDLITIQLTGSWGRGTDPIMIMCSVFLPLLAFSGLIFRRFNGTLLFFGIMSIGVISFIELSHLGLTDFMFEIFRVLVVFPNPDILLLYVMFLYIPLVAVSLDRIYSRLIGRIRWTELKPLLKGIGGATVFSVLILMLIFPSWPFLSGNMGFVENRENYYTYGAFIPEKYSTINEFFIDQRLEGDKEFRTLWLPNTYGDVQIKAKYYDFNLFDYPLGFDRLLFIPSFVNYGSSVLKYAFEDKGTENLGALLAPFNVKYFVVDPDSKESGSPRVESSFIRGDPALLLDVLKAQKDIKLVLYSPRYLIYENMRYIPSPSTFESSVYIDGCCGRFRSDIQTVEFLDYLITQQLLDVNRQLVFIGQTADDEDKNILLSRSELIATIGDYQDIISLSGGKSLVISHAPLSMSGAYKDLHRRIDLNNESTYKINILMPEKIEPTFLINGTRLKMIEIDGKTLFTQNITFGKGISDLRLIVTPVQVADARLSDTPDPLGWWIFDQQSGQFVADRTQWGNRAVVHEGTWLQGDEKGLYLDRQASFVEINFPVTLDLTERFTVEALVEPELDDTSMTIISSPPQEDSGFGFILRISGADLDAQFFLGISGAKGKPLRTFDLNAKGVMSSTLQHVALTYDNGEARLFRNGKIIAESSWNESPRIVTDSLLIGMREVDFPQFYKGIIHEVKVHDSIINEDLDQILDADIPSIKPGSDPFLIEIIPSAFRSVASPISDNTMSDGSHKQSLTERQIAVRSADSKFVYLGEPYHPEWRAFLEDGEELRHTPGFYGGNAYHLDIDTPLMVRLIYTLQDERDILNLLWLSTWILVIVGALLAHTVSRKSRSPAITF